MVLDLCRDYIGLVLKRMPDVSNCSSEFECRVLWQQWRPRWTAGYNTVSIQKLECMRRWGRPGVSPGHEG